MTVKSSMVYMAVCVAAAAAQGAVELSTAADRVASPLRVNMKCIGTIAPRSVKEIHGSNWTLGCETLDRDFANFEEYRRFLAPLGIKQIRLQAGWAKCEREKGIYDFAWLDGIVDYALANGIAPMLETDYGNPIYPGGGGWDLGAGFPTGDEALAAWDAWVDAMAKHFKGRVRDWAMWNEPDIGENRKTPETIAAFNIRTAKVIRRNLPDARIAGLSLANSDPKFFEQCLKAMGEEVKLFDAMIYHGYEPAPETSYANVERLKQVLAKYSPDAILWQGENGCPSEMTTKFALPNISWSEYSQAKWDMRRMLGDLGHDVRSSVFTFCDFNHKGREINRKGLLRANENREVIAVKRAYYAVQNVAGLFDDAWTRVASSGFCTPDASISTYEYVRKSGERMFVFWSHGTDRRYERPGDSFATRPAAFSCTGGALAEPVWVDLLTGRVYEFPKKDMLAHSCGVTYLDVPVYDSPCVLTELRVALPQTICSRATISRR